MWQSRKIENQLEIKLEKDFGKVRKDELFGHYIEARKKLIEEVLPEIKAQEPNLSDHGEEHIGNVLDNAEKLLGEDIEAFNGINIYVLCLGILFHDVGNVYGRTDHQKRISEVYSFVFGDVPKQRPERNILCKIAGAHTGQASDGSNDTLGEVDKDIGLFGESIRAREIASIIRFADELAEGPQRTSTFAQEKGLIEEKSKIYHKYANVVSLHINRDNRRIALTYFIPVSLETPKEGNPPEKILMAERDQPFEKFMKFIFHRISKLDQERQYAKHYCDLIGPFKSTEVSILFEGEGKMLGLDLPTIILDDKVVPGLNSKKIPSLYKSFEPGSLAKAIIPQL